MSIIESYHYGEIVINGKRYSSDVIIFPDRVQDNWYRSKSHQLSLGDITEVLAENPEVVIVGTGASGLMMVLPEVRKEIERRGIKLVAKLTPEACNMYNHLSPSQKVIAVLHLYC